MTRTFHGRGVSPGGAAGPAHVIPDLAASSRKAAGRPDELRSLDVAVTTSAAELERLAEGLRADGHEAEAGIMDAQVLMAADPGLLQAARDGIESGLSAQEAVQRAAAHFRAMLEGLDDPYLAARAADVQDVADRLRRHLLGEETLAIERPSILVARDLTPSQTASLDRSLIQGIATGVGSGTSHTAILARALGIPAVVGLGDQVREIADGEELALDGDRGVVILRPTEAEKRAAHAHQAEATAGRARLGAMRDLPAETTDGHRLTLAANIGSPDDLPGALQAGAEGIGLFRTEFLFAGRTEPPTEDEQVAAYSAVLREMSPRTVVIRTLDVGGDKPLPYLPMGTEMNPFLGERGVRYTLAHTDLLRTQLRALLRASRAGKPAIMLPMVSDLGEVAAVREMLDGLQPEVGGEAPLGVMVEIPGTAVLAETFARHVAFLSAGTNDLVQYGLAVDRTNEHVAHLDRPLHPGILRLLEMTAEGAHAHGKWAGVCGEMAGDLLAVPLLVGLGFDELSMTPSRIPAVKGLIRRLSLHGCRKLAEQALVRETAEEVEDLVRDAVSG